MCTNRFLYKNLSVYSISICIQIFKNVQMDLINNKQPNYRLKKLKKNFKNSQFNLYIVIIVSISKFELT